MGGGVISARLEGGVEEAGDYKEQEGALDGTEEEEEKQKDPGNGWREGGMWGGEQEEREK